MKKIVLIAFVTIVNERGAEYIMGKWLLHYFLVSQKFVIVIFKESFTILVVWFLLLFFDTQISVFVGFCANNNLPVHMRCLENQHRIS